MSPRPSGGRMPSAWKRSAFLVVLAGLVGGNVWLLRRQFPAEEQRRNEAYDAALRAMDVGVRDFARAEIELRKYLAIADEPRVRVLLAIALQAQGKTAAARQEFAAVLAADPTQDRARVGLAEIAEAEQDYAEVLRQLDAADAEEPTPIEASLLRGRVMSSVGDIDAAIAAYRRAIERDADCFDAHLAIGDLLTLRSFLTGAQTERQGAAGSYREAETIVKSRLARGDDVRLRLALARAIAGQVRLLGERDLAEAVRQIREVAAATPKDPEPTLLLAQILSAAGNQVEARRTYEDAASRWPTPDTAIALHDFLASQGEADAARRVLEDAIAKHREDLSLRVRLVAFHVVSGDMAAAERELASAETILSGDWRVHEIRGDLAREKSRRALAEGRADDAGKERAAAAAAYRRALESQPNSLRVKKKAASEIIEAMLARGETSAGPDPDEAFARRCIEDVLRVNGTDAEALEWQARLLLAEGRSREAADLLRPLAASPRPTVTSLRLLGVAATRVGDDLAASEAFGRVLDLLAPAREDGTRDARNAAPDDWCAAVLSSVRAGRTDVAARLARVAAASWGESSRVAAALGAAALAQGDTTGALTVLESARERFPADGEIRLLLARALEAAGRLDDAAREYEAAAAGASSDEARLRYLDFLARTGRIESAEQGFLELIAADPSNPVAHLRLGDFHLARRPPRREDALREYETAQRLDPSSAEPLLRIADLRLGAAQEDPKELAAAERTVADYEQLAPGDPHADYLRAKLALVSGRADEAIERMARFTKARPDRAAGHYFLAVALRAAGRPADALDPLERALRLSPGDERMKFELAALHYDLGVKSYEKGDFAAARQFFARAQAGGLRGDSELFAAGAAANEGQFDVSETELRRVLEREPTNRMAVYMLGSLLLRRAEKGPADEAEALYRRVLDQDPEDIISLLGVGMSRFVKGLHPQAIEVFRRVYPRTQSNPDIALAMCQCWAAMGDLKSAVEFLDGEAAAHPTEWDFPHLKGDFLVSLRQYDLAFDAYAEAARRAPKNAGPVLAAASALVQAGKLEDARKLLVERQPSVDQPALVLVALGDVLAHMDRTDEAQDTLRRALALLPGQHRALYLLGRIAARAGRTDEARKLFRESVDRGSVDPDCHARLAQILAADGDLAGAREAWLGALQWKPRDPQYLNNLALLCARDPKRADEALGYARLAANLAPERGEIADTYGWLLFQAGKHPEAANQLARAAALLERVAEVQFHAGMALSRISRIPEARMHLDRALRLDPKFDGADTARAELERLR